MAICCLPFISGCKQSECAVEENLISDALYRNLPFEMPKVQQPAFPAYGVNIENSGQRRRFVPKHESNQRCYQRRKPAWREK